MFRFKENAARIELDTHSFCDLKEILTRKQEWFTRVSLHLSSAGMSCRFSFRSLTTLLTTFHDYSSSDAKNSNVSVRRQSTRISFLSSFCHTSFDVMSKLFVYSGTLVFVQIPLVFLLFFQSMTRIPLPASSLPEKMLLFHAYVNHVVASLYHWLFYHDERWRW